MIAYAAAHMAALHAMKIGGWQVVTTAGRDPAGHPKWLTAATLRSHPRSTVIAEAPLRGESRARCCDTAGLRETAALLRRAIGEALTFLTPTPAREVAS
jgi:hypothetical protein